MGLILWPIEILKDTRLCVLLTQEFCSMPILKAAEILVKSTVDIIQLREKNLTDKKLMEIGDELRVITGETRTLFFVNDRADIALACSADGVHLGQDDMPAERVPWISNCDIGETFLVGQSTHSLEQAKEAAETEEVSYVAFGPIFPTATKGYTEGVGLEALRRVVASTDKPVMAIGGITVDNVQDVMEAGAQAVAVCSAIIGARDIGSATFRMLEAMSLD